MSRKRQKNQYELAFMTETGSEAPTNGERAELLMAKQEPESGGTSEQLMGFRAWLLCIGPNQPNRRVRTRTHGGVTGAAGDRLPMSIPGREPGVGSKANAEPRGWHEFRDKN